MLANKKAASRLLAKRKREQEAPKFQLQSYLFKEQLDFVQDSARAATACCSVRSGKTVSCAADLIHTALSMPGTTGLYITLSRPSAKRIVWPELKSINKEYSLKGKFNHTELSIVFPNGSLIYCTGANTDAEMEKLRGLSNVAVAYLDESQAFRPHIKELVEDVIIKRLYDTNGRLRIIGTPGPVLSGWFYDTCHSTSYAHHSWTMHNNPWLFKKSGKTPQELIEQDCATRGCAITDPSIQRECFGRWVYDPNSLLLQYSKERNDYIALPPGKYTYILGVDLGIKDCDSLSLIAFNDSSPTTYLVEEILTPNQTTDELSMQIKSLMNKYPVSDMEVDAGGLGLKIVEDLKTRYGLPLNAAEKLGKMSNYRHLNNALRNGTFKARASSQFAKDCDILEKDRAKSTSEKVVVKGHSDAVDSVLYAFKKSPAYSWEAPKKSLIPGTEEYLKWQEEQHWQSAMDQVQRQKDLKESNEKYGSWSKDKKGFHNWNKW